MRAPTVALFFFPLKLEDLFLVVVDNSVFVSLQIEQLTVFLSEPVLHFFILN